MPEATAPCALHSGRSLRFQEVPRIIGTIGPTHALQQDIEMHCDIAVIMDSIASIKIAKDSTFAMLLEAQRRGHPLFYVAPGGLSVVPGKAMARSEEHTSELPSLMRTS